MSELYTTRTTCRVCGNKSLDDILFLGNQYVVNFPGAEDEEEYVRSPLQLVLCDKDKGGCGLLQLRHTFSHSKLYEKYWYRSGVNQTMTDELISMARVSEKMAGLKEGNYVVDIGSNDSTLLRGFQTKGIYRVGFEPAKNIVEKYGQEGVTKVFNDFFAYEPWQMEFGDAKAKIITAIAMFYDLEEPNQFMEDVVKCLDDDGLFVVQQNYLPYVLERNVVDNISHEHLEYFSLTTFKYLMDKFDLEIFDAELNDVNGGSMRTYVRKKGKGLAMNIREGAADRVEEILKKENEIGLNDKDTYDKFAKRLNDNKSKLKTFIKNETGGGKKIYAYGASTRGNSLLQFSELDASLIIAAAERNPDKWGLKMVGTNVPIVSEADAREANPDYFLILPWQFLPEFVRRESRYLRAGGKFIVPLPNPSLVVADGTKTEL